MGTTGDQCTLLAVTIRMHAISFVVHAVCLSAVPLDRRLASLVRRFTARMHGLMHEIARLSHNDCTVLWRGKVLKFSVATAQHG